MPKESSRAALLEVLERLPVGIAVINLHGDRQFVNPRMRALFGWDHTHVDQWWLDAYPDSGYRAEVQARWAARVEAAIASEAGEVEADVYRIRCADGSDVWAEASGVVVGDELFVLFRDITQSLERQVAIRDESSFRQAIINAAADGICVCHAIEEFPHVRFTVWSERMTQITGYSMAEINALGWYQSLYRDPELRARAVARMDRMRVGDNLRAEEWPITRKDGTPGVLAISTSIIPGDEGEPHILGLMQDRTQQRAAEEERRRLEQQMQQAQKLESLGLLAGGIAHDFNNLLVAIMGQADLALEEEGARSSIRERLLEVRQAAERATELTNQMLAYAGKGTFVVGPVDVNAVVSEMTKLLAGSAARHVEVRLALSEGLPMVQSDVSQLRQVVLNLVTNAAEAMETQPGTLSIETRLVDLSEAEAQALVPAGAAAAGRHVQLTVRDTGAGMDAETQARIFEPFFSTKFSGRGLGLAAVLGIVGAHRGGLRVSSEPRSGTTVEVLLPASDQRSPEGGAAAPTPARSGRGTVLLVDDDAQVRRIARTMLDRSGYRVVEASGGPEAMARFDPGAVDAVVLDLTMPVVDGRTVLQMLRARAPELPVVLISGYTEQAVAEELAASTHFLQKPFTRALLVEALEKAMRAAGPVPSPQR